DLAVLRSDIDRDRLEPATLGDSDSVRPADFVFASGNPFSFEFTVTLRYRERGQPRLPLDGGRTADPRRDSDRRRCEPGEHRRTALQPGWRGDRDQHGDREPLRTACLRGDRSCGAVEYRTALPP